MRTMADVWTVVFMVGVKTESHRHPYPNAETLRAQRIPAKIRGEGLNYYFCLPPFDDSSFPLVFFGISGLFQV